jgi:hypothetical protein
MIRQLTSGLLTRTASRKLARWIPNPLLRVVVVAVAGYAIEQLVLRGSARVRAA